MHAPFGTVRKLRKLEKHRELCWSIKKQTKIVLENWKNKEVPSMNNGGPK